MSAHSSLQAPRLIYRSQFSLILHINIINVLQVPACVMHLVSALLEKQGYTKSNQSHEQSCAALWLFELQSD